MKRRMFTFAILLGFLIGCHQGYIALWTDGTAEPAQVFPYKVTSLPPADQQALYDGIYVENALELARLIEDYLS